MKTYVWCLHTESGVDILSLPQKEACGIMQSLLFVKSWNQVTDFSTFQECKTFPLWQVIIEQ